MIDYIIIAVILLIIGGATAYIIKSKKSGKKCVGCPYASSCQSISCQCNAHKKGTVLSKSATENDK